MSRLSTDKLMDRISRIRHASNTPNLKYENPNLLKAISSGKKGVLNPDADGAFKMCVGAIGSFNHHGDFYVYDEVKNLFDRDEKLMRRVRSGAVAGELDHPQRTPGMSMMDYARRLMYIDPKNKCCQFLDFELLPDVMKDHQDRPVVAIMARFFPSGPYGDQLRKSLMNPGEEVQFSIRSFTEDKIINGVNHKFLRQIVTFDQVPEGGMWVAKKLLSPTLESIDSTPKPSLDVFALAVESYIHENIGLESNQITLFDELLEKVEISIESQSHDEHSFRKAEEPLILQLKKQTNIIHW